MYLSNDGYSVYKCYNGLEAMKCIKQSQIDLAILDIMLPDIDGFRLCQKIREKFYFPIIMLTAKIEDSDKIMGLTIGADDYITKPFNPLEVVARVKTQLRRYQSYNSPNLSQSEEKDEYDIRGLLINRVSHKCYLYGKEIALTPLEFSILWYLCEHQGKVVASEELFEAVWKEKYLRNSNNTVMAHIGRLREKLNEPSKNPKFIKTVWGVGYEIKKKKKKLSALYLVQRVCNSMCDLLCAYFWRYFSFRNYGRGNSPQVCFVLLLVLQNSISLYSGCNRVGWLYYIHDIPTFEKSSRLCVRGTGCDRKNVRSECQLH